MRNRKLPTKGRVGVAATASVVRLLAGRDPRGGHRTDARWTKPGTRVLEGHHAGRWAHLSHRRRAGIAWSIVIVLGLLAWSTTVDRWSTAVTVRALVWSILLGALWAWIAWARKRQHRKTVLLPLAERVAGKLDDARYVLDPLTWLDVPLEFADRPTTVYLPLGKTYTEPQEKALVRVIAQSLGLVSPSWFFDMRGERPFVEVRPAPAPRDSVLFSDEDVRTLVEETADGKPLQGLAPRDEPNYLDLDAEAPHVGYSMATNSGKSTAVRGVLAQGLHHGGIALILDRKVESQLWTVGHPSVRYAISEQEIFNALMAASAEIDRRFALVREGALAGRRPGIEELGPRLYLVVEELNTLEIDLRRWWQSVRVPGDPTMCPALPVLGRFLAMGRAARCHAFVIAQKLTAQAIGGTAARENLSTRVLGRASTSTWNMLAPECKVGGKYPRGSKLRGRVHVVFGDQATPVQTVFFTEEEAMTWALSGEIGVWPEGEGGTPTATLSPGKTSGAEVPHLRPVPPLEGDEDEELVTLAEYGAQHGIDVKTLQNARDRGRLADPIECGSGKPSRYRESDLDVWREARAAGVGGDAS